MKQFHKKIFGVSCVLNDHSETALINDVINSYLLLSDISFVPHGTVKSVMKFYIGVFSFNIIFVEASMQSLISYYLLYITYITT